MKKILALVLALAMILMVGAAFAQTKSAGDGPAKITIANAAKGETYKVYKIFDATVDGNGAISYTGTIPDALKNYFVQDSVGTITVKTGDDGKAVSGVAEAVAAYVKTLTSGEVASETSDGSALTFTGLAYGYYGISSTQGAAVTVDSTNPNAKIYDKNTKIVTADKEVDGTSYNIGDTITYTASFDTANYMGEGEDAKQVTKYVISDTLPEFLTNVEVKSITVGGTAITTQQFDSNKQITIPWATENAGSDPKTFTSLYENGAKLVITYTAKLTSTANINTANTNTVKIQPYVWDDQEKPWDDTWEKDAVIKTYGAALKKVDEDGNALKGAIFTIKGLTVTAGELPGEYIVVSYNPADDAAESAELSTNDDGVLYIIGLAEAADLTVTEVKAPDGYNKLTAPQSGFKAQVMTTAIYKEAGTIHYDAKGNITSTEVTGGTTTTVQNTVNTLAANALEIENHKGTELPSTGGIGTTIFYILGGLLVVGAAVILVARRKAQD